jgi:phosphomannomutase
MNGSAGPEIFVALQRCGVEVEALRLIPDGTFPTGSPNPTSKGKMNRAIALAKTWDRSLIIGTDGDGDRLVFGDRRGILNAGFVSLPILYSLIGNRKIREKQPVLYDPKVNPLALQEWAKLDIVPILFRNGHSQIKQFMTQVAAAAAIEESGHYYHQMKLGSLTIYCENSVLTILLLLKSLKEKPAILEELWERQEEVYCTGEFNYQLADDELRDRALVELVEWFKTDRAQVITQTDEGIDLQGTVVRKGIGFDGSQIILSADWYSGYLRIATNEKAVLRCYLSAGRADSGSRLKKTIKKILISLGAVEVE